ncbi:cysteine desulfurase [Candidatus Kaiserbacteria bacterium]|nr:cysteine desulfurase [Candidatus Kaiserbacteria bacterium]
MFDLFKKKDRIYLDYAGATPVCEAAALAAAKAAALFGNPGAIHAEGVQAKRALENARESIAAELGCKAREVVFTSGGTEANNLAILGSVRKIILQKGSLEHTHWIVSAIEHPSVLECFVEIERLGGEVTYVDPDERGIIIPEAVQLALKPHTVFVSIGWGNSEIGTLQPLAHIARELRAHEEKHQTKIVFHTDAGQAPLYRPLQVHSLGVDLLTLDSGKLYGPRGIGALFVGKDVEFAPIMFGGKQERGLRAGTENVALAAGFAAALAYAAGERESEAKRLEKLRDHFASEMIARIPGAVINGDLAHAMPHILNISIPNIQSEYLTLALDHAGIAISTKSACREGEASRSHVVEALGGEPWRSQNTLRFSLGRSTTQEELIKVVSVLASLVA